MAKQLARQEVEEQKRLDPADIFAGVILLFALPGLTYVILAFIGMPVSGRTDSDAVSAFQFKDDLASRLPPPPTKAELDEKLEYVDELKERASVYIDRSRGEEDNVAIDRWQMHARNTLNKARSEVELLKQDLDQAPDLSSYELTLNRHLSDINSTLSDIDKASRFLKN